MTLCDICEKDTNGDPHHPHDPYLRGIDECDTDGCGCDWTTCADCCWECQDA